MTNSAGLAQLVEQLTCNQKVEGSTPLTGTSCKIKQCNFDEMGYTAFCFNSYMIKKF